MTVERVNPNFGSPRRDQFVGGDEGRKADAENGGQVDQGARGPKLDEAKIEVDARLSPPSCDQHRARIPIGVAIS